MEIGRMRGIEGLSNRPTDKVRQADSVSKNIRKEISEAQRQRQALSSKEDLPAAEKVKKRQELQQKISGLNRELKQRRAETRREQQQEALADEIRGDVSGAGNEGKKIIKAENDALKAAAEKKKDINEANNLNAGHSDVKNDNAGKTGSSIKNAEGKTAPDKASQNAALQDKTEQNKESRLQDFEIPQKKWKAVIASDSSREQAKKQETVIARIEGGIAILKSEIKLDEARGADVTKKQAELDKQEAKLQKASTASLPSPSGGKTAERIFPAKPEAASLSQEKEPTEQQPLFKDITVSLFN